MVSEKNIFKSFPYTILCKTSDPRGWVNFDPKGITCTITIKVEDHKMVSQTKYESLRACGFREECF